MNGALLPNVPDVLGGAHRIYLRGPATAHGSPVQNCDSDNACCYDCGENQTSCTVHTNCTAGEQTRSVPHAELLL